MILHKFREHASVLQELFPDITLDSNLLQSMYNWKKIEIKLIAIVWSKHEFYSYSSLASWSGTRCRKLFFENYARTNNFDPLVPSNWYAQPRDNLLSAKVSSPLSPAPLPFHSTSPPNHFVSGNKDSSILLQQQSLCSSRWLLSRYWSRCRRLYFKLYPDT